MAKKPNAFLDFKPSGRTPSKQRPGPKGMGRPLAGAPGVRVLIKGGKVQRGNKPIKGPIKAGRGGGGNKGGGGGQ